jgi:processive 1,2-diacylglycerol beta-glucosyltransferase
LAVHKKSPINTVVAYTTAPWNHALAVLRIVAPLRKAGIEPIHGNPGGRIDPDKVSAADLVLIQRDFPTHLQAYERIVSLARAQSKPVVFDLDDWLLELPEKHPDRISHHYAGGLFPILRAIMEADAVTVSTPELAERVNSLNDNTLVLPNYIDEGMWNLLPRRVSSDPQQPIIIVYMGGDSHAPDFEPLVPVLVDILQTYEERIVFKSIGMQPASAIRELPNVQAIPFQFAYLSYAEFVQRQHFDLAIAPLADNSFNRCKSSMKYLEYSALGIPGVYSRIPPYAGMITEGVNGFLASDLPEWRQAILKLIEDAALRSEMGATAQHSVREQWLLGEHASQWQQAYQLASAKSGLEKTHATLPLSLFADLTRQNRQWEQELESRLHDMQHRVSIEQGNPAESEKDFTRESKSPEPLSISLAGMVNRGLHWILSQLHPKTNR